MCAALHSNLLTLLLDISHIELQLSAYLFQSPAVFGGWGCGVCVQCKAGEEQLCISPTWPGLSSMNGGFADNFLGKSNRAT
jgi:hypothetical protein